MGDEREEGAIRIGLIGCGKIARLHASILAAGSPSALLFCDRHLERAERLAAAHSNSAAFDDVSEMLEQGRPDAVHVLTQLDSHVDLVAQALRAGAHVYVEKPITPTVAEFDELASLAHSVGRVLYPGLSELGTPAVRRAARIIRSGALGGLVTVHCDYNWATKDGGLPYGGGHHWSYHSRGGILQNLADHPTSLVVDALDDIDGTHAHVGRRQDLPGNSPDLLHLTVWNDHQIGSCTISFGHGNTRGVVAYHLEGGTLVADLRTDVLTRFAGSGPQSLPVRTLTTVRTSAAAAIASVANLANRTIGRSEREPGVSSLIHDFQALIRNPIGESRGGPIAEGSGPIVSHTTARRTIDVLDAAWSSTQEAG